MQRAREKEHQLVDKVEAYEVLARYYDQLMDDIDYDYWCEYVLSLVERAEDGGGRKAGDGKNSVKGPAFASRLEGKRVLDLACGTGQFSYRLQQRGLKVTAVDRSDAGHRRRADEARGLRLLIAKICGVWSPSTYDLVLCPLRHLNYLLKSSVAQVLAKAAV